MSTKNANTFTFPSYGSFIYWVSKGYAVLDDASFPIIGEGKTEPNDTFIPQLVADAQAAIDAVDKLGYIDRKRVAVGGHSYGAFMTANLLTHSNLLLVVLREVVRITGRLRRLVSRVNKEIIGMCRMCIQKCHLS